MLQLSIALQVVLSTSKVPHEVAPVHPVALVADEEAHILKLRRNLHADHLTTAVVHLLMTTDFAHPTLIVAAVGRAVHAGEEHVLCILVLVLGTYYEVLIFLVG